MPGLHRWSPREPVPVQRPGDLQRQRRCRRPWGVHVQRRRVWRQRLRVWRRLRHCPYRSPIHHSKRSADPPAHNLGPDGMADCRASINTTYSQSNRHATALCEPHHPRADIDSTHRCPNAGSLCDRAHRPTVRVQVRERTHALLHCRKRIKARPSSRFLSWQSTATVIMDWCGRLAPAPSLWGSTGQMPFISPSHPGGAPGSSWHCLRSSHAGG